MTDQVDRTMCMAGEWQRDGRGLWAERRCQYYRGHLNPSHAFGPWRYDVTPPQQATDASLLALRASVEEIVKEMKRDTEVPQEFGAGWRIVRRWADQLSTLIDPSR